MSFFDLLSKGGPLMYPIILCSVIALAIALERWFYFFRIRGSAAGLQVREKPTAERDDILTRVGSAELRCLTGNLRGLGIVAHISPLLGLLGTVTGMMAAFMKIQELGGEVDAAILAGGIWEALITTAAVLMVAIPTMVFYHYFEGKIDTYYARMKEAAQLLTERLGEKQLTFESRPARRE